MSGLSEAQQLFDAAPGYLNTASNGVPPRSAVEAMRTAVEDWAQGRSRWANDHFFEAVDRARAAFARIVGVQYEQVAIGGSVSALVGLVAAALPEGAEVLVAEGDFTAVQYPFAAQRRLRIRAVPLAGLAAAVRPETALVAVSAVQSADGAVADLPAIRAACAEVGAATLVDATQACGWFALDAAQYDFLVCGAYKWLLAPNGVSLMTVSPAWLERLVPQNAGWFAGEDIWGSIYALPMQLAATARRLDTSPAWMCWAAAAPAFELLDQVGVAEIGMHNVRLANRLRAAVGLSLGRSAIVSLPLNEAAQRRLDAAGVVTATRAGRTRFSCHLYTTDADVDLAIAAIAGS